MPWNTQNGGNGSGPRNPWGGRPSGGGGSGIRPPDIDDILRQGRERLRRWFPNGNMGISSASIIGLLLVGVWLISGVYFVGADEQGVVLRFGKFVARTSPGPNYHLPWPIEVAYTPKVTRENQINIGTVGTNAGADEVAEEALMLTGDENIVDSNFIVFWQIKDAAAYLFNVQNPDGQPDAVIKAVAESAMREAVGENKIEGILTQDREPVQIQVRDIMQKTLDSYGAGVVITRVQMQKADPPGEVIDYYRDVQAASADQDRLQNEAEAYANKVVPEARGKAAQIVQQAEAYKQQVIAEATGEAARFVSVYTEYKKAPEVTRRRMYLETMSQVLAPMNKVIVDDAAKGVVPYFQLPALQRTLRPAAQSSGQQQADQNAAAQSAATPAAPAQGAGQ